MANFNFSTDHQFDISTHTFEYSSDNHIKVLDNNGVVQLDYNLVEEAVAILGITENGPKYYCFGSVTFPEEKFSKSISINENNIICRFEPEELGFIGSDDLRDIRIANHNYFLEGIAIQLNSDGVFLNILCPGSEESTWYEAT